MADAVARRVDAVLVVQFCHEVGRGVHVAAVDERRGVQVAVDAGADAVVACCRTASHEEAVVGAVSHQLAVVGHGMHVDESRGIGVVDVHRHGKRNLKPSVAHAVAAVEEGLRAVGIGEGRLRTVFVGVVQFADDGLLGVAHGSIHDAAEVGRVGHVSHHAGDAAGTQLGLLRSGAVGSDAIDGIDDERRRGQVERQGRVAQQLVLQHVHTGVEAFRDHLVLRPSLGFAERDGLAVFHGQHVAQEGHVHHLVLRHKHRACRTIEGNGTALAVEHGGLADGGGRAVVGHDVARSGDP